MCWQKNKDQAHPIARTSSKGVTISPAPSGKDKEGSISNNFATDTGGKENSSEIPSGALMRKKALSTSIWARFSEAASGECSDEKAAADGS